MGFLYFLTEYRTEVWVKQARYLVEHKLNSISVKHGLVQFPFHVKRKKFS